MSDLAANLRGAALMTGSMALFAINDTFIKALSGEMGLMQVMALRGAMVTPLMLMLALRFGAFRLRMSRRDAWLVAGRSLSEVAAAVFFLTALFNMPLANATAILQALPLVVALAGAVFLGERIGRYRLTAILIGFAGVLMIVRPGGEGFTVWSLWALASVGAVTARDLFTRQMSGALPSLTIATCGAATVGLCAALALPFTEWTPLTADGLAMVAGASGAVLFAYLCSVMAMRVGDIAFVQPFRYTALLWATILGLVVFGDFPAPLTLAGAAVIVAAGLFTYFRERQVARAAARSAS